MKFAMKPIPDLAGELRKQAYILDSGDDNTDNRSDNAQFSVTTPSDGFAPKKTSS